MDSHTLGIKAQRQQFFFRGLVCSAKDFYLLVVLLCAVFILVTCKQRSVNERQNQLELEACRSSRGSFGPSSQEIYDDRFSSESVSKHSIECHSFKKICPSLNSLCFPSTLAGFNENDAESETEALGTSLGYSSGLKQTTSNLTWSRHHNSFRLLDGRLISCSVYQQDDFHEFPPNDGNSKHSQQTDVLSCISPLVPDKTDISKSGQYYKTVTAGFLEGLSEPTVEISPSLMDWGDKNMYNPSLDYLEVKNIDSYNVLTVYDLYSSNLQFYPCKFNEIALAPGEVASICFVFFPTQLGMSSAQLVLQTNFGGFLIQAKGFAVESPYLIKPLSGTDVSSSGKWRKNLTLFNPFDDALHVEEVTAWLFTSSANTTLSSFAKCISKTTEVSSEYHVLSAQDWFNVGPKFAIRPHENWIVDPQKTETIMELDVSYNFEGIFFGTLCLKLSRSSNNEVDTVMVPLEAEVGPSSSSDANYVSISLDVLVPCRTSESVVVALLVENYSPNVMSVIKVRVLGETTYNFQIRSVEGLLLYPRTLTQVAILNYGNVEAPEVNMNCKLLVLINDTRNTQLEIPCKDVMSVCSGSQLHSSVGHTEGFSDVDHINGRQRSFDSSSPPNFDSKVVDSREADESVLRNWKSQASTSLMSVLDANEILYPVVQVGNYTSQWIVVKNPSSEPVVMQLVLNSAEVIDKCKKPEFLLQPSSSSTLMRDKSIAPTRYGFSIAKDALSEAFLHPYGSAYLGPILFQPSNRCEWRSSVLIRNNLSGVEWLSLRGYGGSFSVGLLEGSDPVQSLQFKLNVYSCDQPMTKEVEVKNMGDLPVDVMQIEVSGAECGLDGFRVHDCKGFTLQPRESVKLLISFQTDFSMDTIQRDLELVLATGILVIPMKVSLPIYVLNFCKRAMFWTWLKKVILVLVLAASVLYMLVFLLFHLKDGKNSLSILIHWLGSLYEHFNAKMSGAMSPKMNGFDRSISEEEALLLESAARSSDGKSPGQVHVNRSEFQRQTNSLLDSQPVRRSASTGLSKSLSVENSDMQDASDSQNLTVKVGKEKGRRRRKKKHSVAGVLFEVSSSQSGNSTPSSPLSPASYTTIRRPWPVSPGMERSVEAKNPFTWTPDQQCNKIERAQPSYKVNILANEVTSGQDNHNCGLSSHEKPNLTGKATGRAVLLPSATFPSSGRVVPAWTCHSPILASTSAIALHARAPGAKVDSQKTGEVGKTMGVEKFTYDIWGDHLFGQALTHKSMEVPSNNSHSFFVRGPQNLGENSLLKSVSPKMEDNNSNNNN